MQVAHEGGIFVTCTLPDSDPASAPLRALNGRILEAFGLGRGVSHTEFIRSAGGFLFLETSARVGGAYIVDMVEAATGVNLWREWARLEIADAERAYRLPASEGRHAGIVLSLARQEEPDTSAYTAPEIVHRIRKRHHAGFILASPSAERIARLLEEHVQRFYQDFHASAPAPDRATE
jgi:biotin carboxylase